MGLVSYGKIIDEWVEPFMNFYKNGSDGLNFQEKIDVLGKQIGVTFDINNRLTGQLAYDVAATNQRAFEECFLEIAKPYFELKRQTRFQLRPSPRFLSW
jgi:hypothetical protein